MMRFGVILIAGYLQMTKSVCWTNIWYDMKKSLTVYECNWCKVPIGGCSVSLFYYLIKNILDILIL